MKTIRFTVPLSLLLLAATSLQADTLTGNGSLQTWSTSVLNSNGGPYWNNSSGDGPQYNIGWCVAGTGNCHISNAPGPVSYYGNGTAAASNMSFTGSATPQAATLEGIFTNQNGVPPSGTDVFGWYSVSNSAFTLNPLFNSTAAIGTTVDFTPSTSYGFYLENIQSAGLPYEADYFYFMDDSLDYTAGTGLPDAAATQHFTAFAASNSYFLGIEDTPAASADFDYNDLVVQLQPVPAPEPPAWALLAAGLGAFGCSVRRRRVS